MLWLTHVTNLILGRLTHTRWTITPLGVQVQQPFELKILESVIWRPLAPIVSQKKGPPRQEWCQKILQSYRSKIVAKIIVQFSSYRIHTFCFAPTYPQNGAVHSYSVAAGKYIIGYHSWYWSSLKSQETSATSTYRSSQPLKSFIKGLWTADARFLIGNEPPMSANESFAR